MRFVVSPALALATSLLAFVGGAQAQNYAQANLGLSRLSTDCTGVTCDKKGTGLKLAVGHRYADNVGYKLSYIRFGNFTASGQVNGVAATAKVRGESLGLSGVWFLPLGMNAEAEFRLGGAFNRASTTGQALGVSVRDRETKLRVLFGMGVGYRLTPATTVGVDFDVARFLIGGEGATMRLLSVYGRTEF